jgi:hypothetical protein
MNPIVPASGVARGHRGPEAVVWPRNWLPGVVSAPAQLMFLTGFLPIAALPRPARGDLPNDVEPYSDRTRGEPALPWESPLSQDDHQPADANSSPGAAQPTIPQQAASPVHGSARPPPISEATRGRALGSTSAPGSLITLVETAWQSPENFFEALLGLSLLLVSVWFLLRLFLRTLRSVIAAARLAVCVVCGAIVMLVLTHLLQTHAPQQFGLVLETLRNLLLELRRVTQ